MKNINNSKSFAELISSLKLINISLDAVKAEKKPTFSLPAQINTNILHSYKKAPKNKQNKGESELFTYYVYSSFHVEATQDDKKTPGLNIELKYCIFLSSPVELNDELFDSFKESYLLLIVYPYFRYAVQDITLKMGLPPLILDLVQLSPKRKQSPHQ